MARWLAVVVCVGTVLQAASLRAQTTPGGSVRGVVTDVQGGVLPGAVVTAASPAAPGVHQAVTDGRGRYRLGELPPGEYTVAVELDGFSRVERSPIVMRAGLHVDVDLVLQVGGLDETVRVVQETPLLETERATQTVNVSGELLRSMPLSERREWFGAVMLAPGVTAAANAPGSPTFSVHGAEDNSNVVQIDGADVGPPTMSGLNYLSINTDAIEDIQIKTSGLDASAPLGTGGIISIATASGTNRVTGASALYLQPRRWNDSNVPGGTSSAVDQTAVDLSGGAPLVRDHLWAFGSYRFTDAAMGVSRSADQVEALEALIPGFEPFDNTNRAHFWLAKLTAQPAPRHRLSGFYQRDVNPARTTQGRERVPRIEVSGGAAASARWSAAWSDHFTTRVSASFNDKRRDVRDPEVEGPVRNVYQETLASAGRLVGLGHIASIAAPSPIWTRDLGEKVTVSLDGTVLLDRGPGTHQIQFGVYLQPRLRVGLDVFYQNDGYTTEDTVLTDPTGFGSYQPFHRQYMEAPEFVAVDHGGRDEAVYIQDAWRPTSRLTVSGGVRLDSIHWRDRRFDVDTVQTIAVGPRVGVNYAVTADARNVVRAHWVRVHEQPAATAVSPFVSRVGSRDVYDLDLDGTFETEYRTPGTFGDDPTHSLDSDLTQPSVRELGLGYSRQLPGRTSVAVNLLDRHFDDRLVYVETNARYDGRQFVGYADERYNDVFEATNSQWNHAVYRSLELSFSTSSGPVHGMASYVRQWRHLAGTWQPNDPASFIQPDAFPNDRGIGSPTALNASGLDANSLSGYSMAGTSGPQWQDHVVRLGISAVGPWDVLFATSYVWQSGSWSGPIVSRIAAPDPAFGPPTVALSNGRVVPNPLATTLRFAYDTRGDGQFTTPPLHLWNLRIGKAFSTGPMRFDVGLDVFNVTNNGADLLFNFGANQTFNPAFGATLFRQQPRSAQMLLRLRF